VTLQENNGVAKIDLATKTITNIFPLGYKTTILPKMLYIMINGSVLATAWKLKGMFQPDAITNFEINKTPILLLQMKEMLENIYWFC
jgi:hypothetical protein